MTFSFCSSFFSSVSLFSFCASVFLLLLLWVGGHEVSLCACRPTLAHAKPMRLAPMSARSGAQNRPPLNKACRACLQLYRCSAMLSKLVLQASCSACRFWPSDFLDILDILKRPRKTKKAREGRDHSSSEQTEARSFLFIELSKICHVESRRW